LLQYNNQYNTQTFQNFFFFVYEPDTSLVAFSCLKCIHLNSLFISYVVYLFNIYLFVIISLVICDPVFSLTCTKFSSAVVYRIQIKVEEAGLDQCFSTAGPRPGTGPRHQLYRAARGSPGICHFNFLRNFHE